MFLGKEREELKGVREGVRGEMYLGKEELKGATEGAREGVT